MSMILRLWLPPRVPMGNFPDLSPWSAGGVFPRRPPPTSDAGKHANESHHQIGDSFVLHTSTAQRRIPPINRLAPEMQNIPRSWGSELAELSISRGSGHLYSAARPQSARWTVKESLITFRGWVMGCQPPGRNGRGANAPKGKHPSM